MPTITVFDFPIIQFTTVDTPTIHSIGLNFLLKASQLYSYMFIHLALMVGIVGRIIQYLRVLTWKTHFLYERDV